MPRDRVLRLALIGCLAVAGDAFAAAEPGTGVEQYRVVHWTTAQGLPQNTINDIVVLPNGELWLATFGGLARFDGHGFTVLDMASDDELPANRVVSLAVAGTGSFYFLTQQGHLGRVDAGKASLLVSPPTASVDTLELVLDGAGGFLCRSGDGRAWRTDGKQPWQPVRGPQGRGPWHDLVSDATGVVWGVWGDRLVQVLGEAAAIPLPESGAVAFPRPAGGLWLGLRRGVGRVLAGRLDHLVAQPPFDDPVLEIEPAGADALWVASPGAVSRLDRQVDGSWRRTAVPLRLPANLLVRSLRVDAASSLWVGTSGNGLYRVNRLPIRRFTPVSGEGDVSALASDGHGGAYIAGGCRHLSHVDRTGVAVSIPLPSPDDPAALWGCGVSLDLGPDDRAWARVGPNLVRVDQGVAQLVTDRLPVDEGPLVANPDGSFWVVSRSGSVRLVSSAGGLILERTLPAPLMSASRGPDDALWVGGESRVYRVSRAGVDWFGEAEGLARGLVRDVVAEPDGTVWTGSYGGGVGRLRAGRVARLTTREGLPDNSVSRMLDDGRGRIWVSTNRGLAVVEKGEMDAVADGRVRALAPVVFGAERGVPEANFGSPAGFAGDDGRLWFGTIDGAVSVDAARFPFNTTPPAARIDEVYADNQVLPISPTVRVPPRVTRLRLRFSAVDLLYPEQMRFRFRVEGIDPDWVEAGSERIVDWSPPGPGRYRFLVDARNEDGIWSSAPASVVLDILPAWWQTTTLRVAAGLALMLLGAAVFRQRIRQIERRHGERIRLLDEQRRAEERMNTVRAQLEHVSRAALAGELAASLAHEVHQPIGAIVNNAEAGRRHLAQYLQRPSELAQIFADIVADGLRASDVVQGLRGFLQAHGPAAGPIDLSTLVREMLPLVRRELQNNHVEISIDLADDLPPVEGLRVQLGQIVVNLVINACEALAQVEGERRVTIATADRGGRVELVVSDNGPGLRADVAERVFDPFVTTKPEGLGVGLAICRSIAERHGGHLQADGRPGGGLRMTLSLPAAPATGAEP